MRAPLIISLLLSLFTGFVHADMTIRYDAITPNQKKPVHSVLIKQNLVRVNQVAGQKPDIMVNLTTGEIIQLHSESKSFFRTNTQTINQYVSLYRQNKGLMQGLINQGIKHLDPQKQGQIQQMLENFEQKSSTPLSISLKNTGKFNLVLGVQCQVFAIIDQGRRTSDVCLASYKQLELTAEDVASFEKLKKLVHQFKQSNPEQMDLLSIMANGLENLNGVPMKIVRYYPDGKIKNMMQAGSISFRKVPTVAYQIPQNYQEKLTPIL